MNNKCEVLRIYKTSFGDIFELGFLKNVLIKPGMYVKDINDQSLKITGVAMNNSDILLRQHNNLELQSIWDCQIELVEGAKILVGDMLFLYEV